MGHLTILRNGNVILLTLACQEKSLSLSWHFLDPFSMNRTDFSSLAIQLLRRREFEPARCDLFAESDIV